MASCVILRGLTEREAGSELEAAQDGSIRKTAGNTLMKSAETKAFTATLQAMRARLRGDVTTMADAALRKTRSESSGDLSSMPIHMADIGSDAYEQEFTLTLMATEEDTLDLVEQALERIRTRRFGTCEECGGVIAKKRLEAIPFAPTCIRCAEKLENGGFGGSAGRPRQPR